tara:strand:+ start:686 stop:1144 length:459 start_codon:yes stop_codon:yes gene_type:complete
MSVIYKIFCKNENIKDCYIGSTNNFNDRKRKHIENCNNISYKSYNIKLYKFIRDNGNFNNWDFEILETFENIISNNDLHKIEAQYIKNNNSTLNSNMSGRTKKEYYENKKNQINNKRAQKITCECGAIISISVKYKHIKTYKHKQALNKNTI